MRKLITLAVVLGLLVSGCGGHLVAMNRNSWSRMMDHTNVDDSKFEADHNECCDYTARVMNIPFADGLGFVPSTKYYEKCMQNKGYVSKRDYNIYKHYEHKQFEE